jgi:hypothetical protein
MKYSKQISPIVHPLLFFFLLLLQLLIINIKNLKNNIRVLLKINYNIIICIMYFQMGKQMGTIYCSPSFIDSSLDAMVLPRLALLRPFGMVGRDKCFNPPAPVLAAPASMVALATPPLGVEADEGGVLLGPTSDFVRLLGGVPPNMGGDPPGNFNFPANSVTRRLDFFPEPNLGEPLPPLPTAARLLALLLFWKAAILF